MSELTSLLVWDALEVGPASIEPARLRIPYTLVIGPSRVTRELLYRYEAPVLEPARDANLAALIGAQLALNYGLFARRLVFHGPLDPRDQELLRGMAELTCREILVHKLSGGNPFVPDLGLELPADGMFLQAALEFPDACVARPDPRWGVPDRIAVSSSGGKESLLGLGLLEDLGLDVHPLFLNESGRHWYTALNGYRHLQATRPNTARVWSSCDRIFAWLARSLPFVRAYPERIRADVYPLRMWTVGVFVFGLLPLLRHRRIGRLVIGSEYDTTVVEETRGITHYGGLFDQSRFFDEELTQLFRHKGWGVEVFSLLRPASDLLIQTLVARRYPELLAHQVSCHAARIEAGRALPCGRCEKCRRVVGVLVAGGFDPRSLGYAEGAIEGCLVALSERGAHQEAPVLEHIGHLLVEARRVRRDSPMGRSARPRPEVLRARFDELAAPRAWLPLDLRGPVLSLLDPKATAFGGAGFYDNPKRLDVESIEPERRAHVLGELTWPQARVRLREVDVALLPVGAIEQHGPHLSLDTDAWDAEHLAHRVAEACPQPRPLVLPLLPYGVSYHHESFAGTIGVAPQTLSSMVCDIGRSLHAQGIRKLLIVNGHGGNVPALHLAAQVLNRELRLFVCVETGETSDLEVAELVTCQMDLHAGEIETSTSLATRPHLVRMEYAISETPRIDSPQLEGAGPSGVAWYLRTERYSRTGVMGDARAASVEKGEKIWEIQTLRLAALAAHLVRTPVADLVRGEAL